MFNIVLGSSSGRTRIDTSPQFIPIGIAHSNPNNASAIGYSSFLIFLFCSLTFVSWDHLSDKQIAVPKALLVKIPNLKQTLFLENNITIQILWLDIHSLYNLSWNNYSFFPFISYPSIQSTSLLSITLYPSLSTYICIILKYNVPVSITIWYSGTVSLLTNMHYPSIKEDCTSRLFNYGVTVWFS